MVIEVAELLARIDDEAIREDLVVLDIGGYESD